MNKDSNKEDKGGDKGGGKGRGQRRPDDDDDNDDDIEDPLTTTSIIGNDDVAADNNNNNNNNKSTTAASTTSAGGEEEEDASASASTSVADVDDPLATPREVFSFIPNIKTRIYFILGIIFASISGMIFPALAFLFSNSFSDLSGNPTSDQFLTTIRELAYSFMILGVFAFVFMTLQATFLEMSSMEMTNNLKTKWFRALLRQDMAYYDLRDISGTATLLTSNAIKFRRGVGKKLGDGIQFFFTVILGLVYGFYSSWQVSLLILAVIPFMALSAMWLTKLVTSQTQRANTSYAKAGSIVYTTVSSIRTILSLNGVEFMINQFKGATQEAYDAATKQVWELGLANGCMMSSFLLSYIPVTLYGSYLLYSNVQETGCDPSGSTLDNPTCEPVSATDVFGAMFGVTFAGSVMPQITASYEAFMKAQSAAYPALEAIYRDTSTDSTKDQARLDEKSQALQRRGSSAPLPKYTIDSMSTGGRKIRNLTGGIEFHDVYFAYPSRLEVDVFKGLSLKIPAGQTVALVGVSGGGKSTTVHLLERFYDVSRGYITIDDTDIRSLNIQWLRRQIGLVSQEPKLFAQSIRENIAIGLPGATQQQIEEAARKANAHDFITSFPNGYDTQVGDEGSQMSGGQKQRIAIARVLIKKPKILLLDEATSALDSESEAVVQEALDVLMQEGNQTVIVIAHRLSTVRNADMIAVVSEGKVVETGNHEELMMKGGAYADLVEAQTRASNRPSMMIKAATSTTAATISTTSASSQTSSNPPSRSDSFNNSNNGNNNNGAVLEQSEFLSLKEVAIDIGNEIPVIRFNDVHFHYPSRPKNKIFRGLNLAVKEGETLAIVGPSGQGKSTLIQLIESFYRPTDGNVEFQGVDLADLNVRWVRDQLSLVSQEPVLFDATIGENIRFGSPGATQSEVEWAAKEANAHNFIMDFPDKYDTQVGSQSSLQISGGQKQRIAIARALLRKPKVLLLDEATSALDSESEHLVQEALDKIMADMTQTTIVIAHRLSTIRNADRIAVIDHGKVREIGTHDELMAKPKGKYRRLQDLQNLDGLAKKSERQKEDKHDEEEDVDDGAGDDAEEEMDPTKEKERKYAERARLLAKGDRYYFVVGAFGALLAGLMFPAWGFIFAFMVKAIYFPVYSCDDDLDAEAFGFVSCEAYWEDVAAYMKDLSLKVFYGLLGLMGASMSGNVLMIYGFGTATERMNKRVRDSTFRNLIRQEVAYFDLHPVGTITSQLADDAALIHSFSGQPIRLFVMNLASVVVGIIVAFVYMWPFAFLAFGLLPFMSLGKALEIQTYMGDELQVKVGEEDLPANSSGGIMVESLLNIRTVASLTIEEERIQAYQGALSNEDPHPVRTNVVKGSAGGISQFVQMWGMGLMFWFGGWLIFRFPEKYDFEDMMISMFGLLFGLTGIGIAMADLTDSEKAKAAARRIFDLIDRESSIDPLSESGLKEAKTLVASKTMLLADDEEEEVEKKNAPLLLSDPDGGEKLLEKRLSKKHSSKKKLSVSPSSEPHVVEKSRKSVSPKQKSKKKLSPNDEAKESTSGIEHHHHHHKKSLSSPKQNSKKKLSGSGDGKEGVPTPKHQESDKKKLLLLTEEEDKDNIINKPPSSPKRKSSKRKVTTNKENETSSPSASPTTSSEQHRKKSMSTSPKRKSSSKKKVTEEEDDDVDDGQPQVQTRKKSSMSSPKKHNKSKSKLTAAAAAAEEEEEGDVVVKEGSPKQPPVVVDAEEKDDDEQEHQNKRHHHHHHHHHHKNKRKSSKKLLE